MKKNPLVSIITPVYNSQKFVENAIKSVLGQSFQDWEHIIIDDCSNDSSSEIIRNYVTVDDRIQFVELNKNSGAAVARNAGIERARGRYIAFLDSDDTWFSYKLELQLKFMEENDVGFSCSAYYIVDASGKTIGVANVPKIADYHSVLMSPRIGCLTAIYDTQKIGKVYMPLIRKRQDFGLWLSVIKKTGFVYGLQEPTASYLSRPDSISANKVDAARYTWRIYREVEGLGFFRSLFYFLSYAIRNGIRSKAPRLANRFSI